MADIDKDGDLDLFTGSTHASYWLENMGRSGWTLRHISDSTDTDVGAAPLDVDGDGWIDRISGSFWHRNLGATQEGFRTIRYGDFSQVHDLYVGDVDGDGRKDVVTLEYNQLFWARTPPNPASADSLWERHFINQGPAYANQHGGLGLGDLDGDGDLDVSRLDRWYANPGNGVGHWVEHANLDFGREGQWGLSGRALILDLDGNGKLDLFQTECDFPDGRVAWFENRDGKGLDWERHILKDSGDGQDFHSLLAADFDGDGDDDIFSMGAHNSKAKPKGYIWENQDGKGRKWIEHVVYEDSIDGHEAAAGDFDGDGDVDIVAKTFTGTTHILLENRRIVTALGKGRRAEGKMQRPKPDPGKPRWAWSFVSRKGPTDLKGRSLPRAPSDAGGHGR